MPKRLRSSASRSATSQQANKNSLQPNCSTEYNQLEEGRTSNSEVPPNRSQDIDENHDGNSNFSMIYLSLIYI